MNQILLVKELNFVKGIKLSVWSDKTQMELFCVFFFLHFGAQTCIFNNGSGIYSFTKASVFPLSELGFSFQFFVLDFSHYSLFLHLPDKHTYISSCR